MRTEVLIIGSGLAGSVAALAAAEEGREVTLITKEDTLIGGNTPRAQGGIIYKNPRNDKEKLIADVMAAGDGHCRRTAVEQLAEEGPELLEKYLFDIGNIDFDKDSDGNPALTSEGAHSQPRIIHSQDRTGATIMAGMSEQLIKHPNIKILYENMAVDLMTLSHHSADSLDIYQKPACFGASVLDIKEDRIYPIFANNTILAAGGLGQIYRHTTNPESATGDGLSIAWRSGARCFNLHYIQFHPTAFYSESGDRFLVSEAVRGEGGKLIDNHGKPFMHQYSKQGDLSSRDKVARGIFKTMLNTGHPCVYLDITHKNENWIRERFPTIYNHCLKNGVDPAVEPIPVVPAAHYSCGGVGVNLYGRTSLRRLYAVGEVACTGVHGANRLASTSLLEAVVWGHKAGESAAANTDSCSYFPQILPWKDSNELIDPALIAQDWQTIKSTMWNYVGLIRTRRRLERANQLLRHLHTEVDVFYKKAKLTKETIQLRNGVQSAIAISAAATQTKFDRKGCHYLDG